jgi:hypothetical protein
VTVDRPDEPGPTQRESRSMNVFDTVQRVETDAEGDAYEAHMTDADGNEVTVELAVDFKVTPTEEGGRPAEP